MKFYSYVVLVLFFRAASSTFWYKNDLERVMGSYKSDLSKDYLRALSIFKRKLQLLGFYPIVLNDDGLEYVSADPFLIEDDYDDRMYELLKKMKKEKKARTKSSKKKSKKSKKTTESPIATTTVQPITNIVYFWPSTITTIVHPGSNQQRSFDTAINKNEKRGEGSYENESSEESSSEAYWSSSNKKNYNEKQQPAKVNYETSFSFEQKLKLDDDERQIWPVENKTLISSTSSTTTTTAFPLITVIPDPEEVAIQEILDQQEIVNKISDKDQVNITKTVSGEGHDLTTESQDNLTKPVSVTVEIPNGVYESLSGQSEANPTLADNMKIEGTTIGENGPSQSTNPEDVTSTDVTESSNLSTQSILLIPAGVLQFFHETLPAHDDQSSTIGSPSSSEIVDIIPVPSTEEFIHISDEFSEISENNKTIDGHPEIGTERNNSLLQINEETTTIQHLEEHLTSPNRTSAGTDHTETTATEGYEYSIDPKITLPIDFNEGLESRSLTDKPVVAVIVVNDKIGRRSDVPIEAEDDEDTTDNLPYNLTSENLLERSNVVENTSAETGTPPSSVDELKLDNIDPVDGEIIPLIPLIIKQIKQGNVSPEETDILKNTFGQLWPYIVKEANRDSDSSEEMNPLLSEVLNSVNRRIVKREATLGTWRRPIYGRRIYFDDDDDYVQRRRYYGLRRRPIVAYY